MGQPKSVWLHVVADVMTCGPAMVWCLLDHIEQLLLERNHRRRYKVAAAHGRGLLDAPHLCNTLKAHGNTACLNVKCNCSWRKCSKSMLMYANAVYA